MNNISLGRRCWLCAYGLLLTLTSGCGLLQSRATPQPAFYSLDNTWRAVGAVASARAVASNAAPILIVNPSHAAAGFESSRIIYTREPHQLEYFAHSEWIEPPARMLVPLVVAAVESSGAFRAVIPTPSAAVGDLRLDTEIIRLQHEFGALPSRAHFTLRAYIVDNTTRLVLAWREFDESAPATSEDPYGGVVAANRVIRLVLEDLSTFCAEQARIKSVDN